MTANYRFISVTLPVTQIPPKGVWELSFVPMGLLSKWLYPLLRLGLVIKDGDHQHYHELELPRQANRTETNEYACSCERCH